MYANQRGCDGNRLYFDGSSLVCVNGSIVGQVGDCEMFLLYDT
jgi:NAD+ synthase (glutamine-hydrolysing)